MHGGSFGVLTGTARTEADLAVAIVVISAILLLVHFVQSVAFKRRRARGAAQFDSNASHFAHDTGSPTPAMRPVTVPKDNAHTPVAPSFTANQSESTFRPKHARSAQAAPTAPPRTTPRLIAPSTSTSNPPLLRSSAPEPAAVTSGRPTEADPPGLPMLPLLPPALGTS